MGWPKGKKRGPRKPKPPTHTDGGPITPITGDVAYSSWGEFCAAANAVPVRGGDTSGSWLSTPTTETRRLAERGWPEGVAMATPIVDKLASYACTASGMAEQNEVVSDVCGAAFDVGAVLAGEPECWARPAPIESRRAVTIAYNLSASAGVDEADLRARGIAISALVMALQARGVPVLLDLYYVHVSYGLDKRVEFRIRVLDASGSILDLDRLVFAIAHPGVYRGMTRSISNGVIDPVMGPEPVWNGTPMSNEAPRHSDVAQYDLVIAGAHLNDLDRYGDPKKAQTWVLRELERLAAASQA